MDIKIFQVIKSLLWKSRKRLMYGLMGFIMAITLPLGFARIAYSFSIWDLIVPAIQVFQLSNLSDSQEIELGKQINAEIVREVRISRNTRLTNYINNIGQKLAQTSERSNIPYTFQVVEDDSINAFATMGGYVYIQEGLIKAAKNESELAGVMGHEIAHIVARHAVNQMKDQALTQGILSAAGLDQSAAVQIGVQLALGLPHSRGDELEADRLGLDNITKACYDPSGMVGFMKTLEEASSGGSMPTFLSTHPSPNNRVSLLEERIDTNKESNEMISYVESNCLEANYGLNQEMYYNQLRSVGFNI